MVVIFGPQTTSAFAGIPEPALAGEFTCRKAGKRPYGRAAKPPPTARDIPQKLYIFTRDEQASAVIHHQVTQRKNDT
jgi:hypothetical protein